MKFFQELRREIVGKNQTRKYLKYATGEIILVVIGILIALSINNWNENRRKEAVVIETLKEIHRDLSGDIIESNYLISKYSKEDSLIYILLTKELSKEDSGEHQWLTFASVAHSYTDLKLNDNGYKMLMENSDHIPMKY